LKYPFDSLPQNVRENQIFDSKIRVNGLEKVSRLAERVSNMGNCGTDPPMPSA
jgi:hypothetical protein